MRVRTSPLIRRYSELKTLETFKERFEYLKLDGRVAAQTFGTERYLNQAFYRSAEWKSARSATIARDLGYDLGIPGYSILHKIMVHHMNPITLDDVDSGNPDILNPEFLITVSMGTHNDIHYGSKSTEQLRVVLERTPGDTTLW